MELAESSIFLSLFILTFLEIILGIDNLIFIALVVCKLPQNTRKSARILGLALALIIRVLMLMALSWVMTLTEPLFYIADLGFSFKNFLQIFGGFFLIVKSGWEICGDIFAAKSHNKGEAEVATVGQSFLSAVLQITLIDFIFSFDSIVTAIGMTNNIPVIVIAMVIAMFLMIVASGYISEFLNKYPSLKIVALAFIFMVGAILVADGFYIHISKGYLYFSLFFTLAVELINIASKKRS